MPPRNLLIIAQNGFADARIAAQVKIEPIVVDSNNLGYSYSFTKFTLAELCFEKGDELLGRPSYLSYE